MKKKVKCNLSMLLAGVMVMGCLAGCGKTEEKPSDASASVSTAQTDQPSASSESEAEKGPITTEPITISILTARHENATNNAEDIWFFKYMEYWFKEQGYDVTLDVSQVMSEETAQQLNLMLATDNLPDLIWSVDLSPANAVIYGETEGMILDWTPYLNEETMPNLMAAFAEDPDSLAASTCSNGAVYSIPSFGQRKYGNPSLTFGMSDRVFVNEKWLEQCDQEIPTNIDEFLDMLRAFKEVKLEGDAKVVPLLNNASFFEKFLWTGLGYYGNSLSQYGTEIAIKDGEVTLPAYNKEDYRTFIEIMKTCFDEGLISPDFFTMDSTMKNGLSKSGVNGVECDYTLGNVADFHDWVMISPFAIGDNDEVAISASSTYNLGKIWASADTEYPEVIAMMIDYLLSEEGSVFYFYGPQEGQDPLGLVDGWYMNAEGLMTTKLVENGTFSNFGDYCTQYIHSSDYAGKSILASKYVNVLKGIDETPYIVKDVITGEDIVGVKANDYTDDTAGHRWRKQNSLASEPYVTAITFPAVYMTEDDSLKVGDLKIVLEEHIKTESAKFITGVRPLSEIDAFIDELKKMEVEDYINTYKEAYAPYMNSYFK